MTGRQPIPGNTDPRSNRDVFEGLLRPCLGSLYSTALRMTGDANAAEDLVQEVSLNAYRGFGKFLAGTNFKAWLFRILKNASIDKRRRTSRSPFVDLDDDTMDGIPQLEERSFASEGLRGPEVHILHKTFRQDASRAMTELDPEIRIVVSLALLEELSYQEIADIVDCPVGTVRSRLSRGRQTLRNVLKDYIQDEDRSCGKKSAIPSGAERDSRDVDVPGLKPGLKDV